MLYFALEMASAGQNEGWDEEEKAGIQRWDELLCEFHLHKQLERNDWMRSSKA